jgi:hypothetical protein
VELAAVVMLQADLYTILPLGVYVCVSCGGAEMIYGGDKVQEVDLVSKASAALVLRKGSILLLEPQSYPLRAFPQLIHATHDAAFFPRGERLGGKVGDAVFKACLDERLVCL